ncbi:MAG: hypothetical protein ABIC91_08535 [Nanoarchaeota archaeon]|nr:hypothetical protein [Nanoarchaeota archaeon]MBU1030318.1 hypothetical protein [Nanoarchaeota archaeon]MBU1849103.1 hypothetical protein [Nanoarchaeota archaeon]
MSIDTYLDDVRVCVSDSRQYNPYLKKPYETPRIVYKDKLTVDLQTNYMPDEPPPPL